MNNSILKIGIRFVFLVLLQVILLNNIFFLGYINPMIYILFVFLFPILKDRAVLLLLSFFLGLSIDFFSNSGGINAGATLFIAYFRLPILHIILKKSEFDYLLFNIKNLTFTQSVSYIFLLTFIHHLIVYSLEYYKLEGFIFIIGKATISSVFTAILIGFSILLFSKK